jgi:hypothetical protein
MDSASRSITRRRVQRDMIPGLSLVNCRLVAAASLPGCGIV